MKTPQPLMTNIYNEFIEEFFTAQAEQFAGYDGSIYSRELLIGTAKFHFIKDGVSKELAWATALKTLQPVLDAAHWDICTGFVRLVTAEVTDQLAEDGFEPNQIIISHISEELAGDFTIQEGTAVPKESFHEKLKLLVQEQRNKTIELRNQNETQQPTKPSNLRRLSLFLRGIRERIFSK